MYRHSEMTGSLFMNDRKAEGTKQPDYRGSAMLNGTFFKIVGWKNKDKKGKTFLGLKFSVPQPKNESSVQNQIDKQELWIDCKSERSTPF